MKNFIYLLIVNVLPVLLGYASFVLAKSNIDGWGWFLFVAMLTSASSLAVLKKTTKNMQREFAEVGRG